MSRPVRVATGNTAKMQMLGGFLTAAGLTPVPADPGDAEGLAPVGYESAVLAKLAGALARDPDAQTPVVAHDSGFEFECLGGTPGPDTKRWLAEVGAAVDGVLVAGTAVRVVHQAALWLRSEIRTFQESDLRVVPDELHVKAGELPLTGCFVGPDDALERLMARVTAAIGGHDQSGPAVSLRGTEVLCGGPIKGLFSDGAFDPGMRALVAETVAWLRSAGAVVTNAHIAEGFTAVDLPSGDVARRDHRWCESCDVYVALLPVDAAGPVASAGTAIELGWVSARGKPIVILWEASRCRDYSHLVRGLDAITQVTYLDLRQARAEPGLLLAAVEHAAGRSRPDPAVRC